MDNYYQEIYINLDDSGKLTNKEHTCVYGGLVFLSKKEKDKFITQYRSIIKDIKCNYCSICNNKCPEIKNTNIKSSDKRRLMNYIKKYNLVALIINNDDVYQHIKNNKGSKGRFLDYAIRRMIKEIIIGLIKENKIDSHKPLRIIINLDEQTTKNNGYYNLHDGLIEELKYGISNFNYAAKINPILFNDLEIKVSYQNSSKSYVVQAADLMAGTIRRSILDNRYENLVSIINYQTILP